MTEVISERVKGTVVFFDDSRGWGFVRADGAKCDQFCHYSQIKMPDPNERRTLEAGQRVEFELNKRDGKVQAENVVPLEG